MPDAQVRARRSLRGGSLTAAVSASVDNPSSSATRRGKVAGGMSQIPLRRFVVNPRFNERAAHAFEAVAKDIFAPHLLITEGSKDRFDALITVLNVGFE